MTFEDVPAPETGRMTHTFHETRLLIARCVVLFLLAAASVIAYLTRHSLAVANTTIQAEL